MPHEKGGSVLMYHWHRPRPDGGFDLLNLVFDAHRKPAFHAMIQKVGSEGLVTCWGEHVPYDEVNASHSLKRVFVQRVNRGVWGMLLPKWFGHVPFSTGADSGPERSRSVCNEFLACFGQAERWWEDGSLGPNVIEGELVIENPRHS